MQPQVRDLQSLIAEQQAGLQPQYDIINNDIAANDTSGAAQVAGLNATKEQAFGDITQQAQNKGMFFSGFTPNEQAKYTATTYLPALASLQSTIAQTRSGLFGKKADLGTKAFDIASQQRENDRQVLADWQKMTAQQQFQASEADKQRVFDAQQNEANRRTSSANANVGAADAAAAKASYNDARNSTLSFLDKYKGGDGFVSPKTFQDAQRAWTAKGQDPGLFGSLFGGWANPSHLQDYVGK